MKNYHSSEAWEKLRKMKFAHFHVKNDYFYFVRFIGGYRVQVDSNGHAFCGVEDFNGVPFKKYNTRKVRRFIRKVNKVLENDKFRFNRITL